jgi:hypothetical protein
MEILADVGKYDARRADVEPLEHDNARQQQDQHYMLAAELRSGCVFCGFDHEP